MTTPHLIKDSNLHTLKAVQVVDGQQDYLNSSLHYYLVGNKTALTTKRFTLITLLGILEKEGLADQPIHLVERVDGDAFLKELKDKEAKAKRAEAERKKREAAKKKKEANKKKTSQKQTAETEDEAEDK